MPDATRTATFHDYQDIYTHSRALVVSQHGKKWADAHFPGPAAFYARMAEYRHAERLAGGGEVGGLCVPMARTTFHDPWAHYSLDSQWFAAEMQWLAAGRPYYRIYPDYVEVFRRTKLEVPIRCLHLPFPAFSVRFAVGQEPTYQDGSVKATALLVSCGTGRDLMRVAGVPGVDTERLIDEVRRDVAGGRLGLHGELLADADRMLMIRASYVYADDPERHNHDRFMLVQLRDADLDKTVAEKLAEPHANGFGETVGLDGYSQFATDSFAVAFTVCFLATGGDRLIEPDVLNGDLKAYLAAVNGRERAAAANFAAKATRVRNGQPGFTIGRADSLLGRRADYQETHEDEEEREARRALRHQHLRSGHVRFIKKGDQHVGVWVRHTTVRPDLPPAPEYRHGERTPLDKREEATMLAQPQPGATS